MPDITDPAQPPTHEQQVDRLLQVIAAAFNSIQNSDTAFVAYNGSQTLTPEEQQQALHNVGGASTDSVSYLQAQLEQQKLAIAALPAGNPPVDPGADYASKFVGLLTDPNLKAAAEAAISPI